MSSGLFTAEAFEGACLDHERLCVFEHQLVDGAAMDPCCSRDA